MGWYEAPSDLSGATTSSATLAGGLAGGGGSGARLSGGGAAGGRLTRRTSAQAAILEAAAAKAAEAAAGAAGASAAAGPGAAALANGNSSSSNGDTGSSSRASRRRSPPQLQAGSAGPGSSAAALPPAAPVLYGTVEQAAAAAAEERPGKRRRVGFALPEDGTATATTEAATTSSTAANGRLLPAGSSEGQAQAPVAGNGSLSQQQEQENEEEGEEEEQWVQCENVDCLKWRPLPAGHALAEDEPWFCSLHPRRLTCSEPEKQDYGAQFSSCPGYVPNGQPLGSPDNVSHFATIIASHPIKVNTWYQSPLRWLAGLEDPQALKKGMRLPPEYHTYYGAYEHVFEKFELERAAAQPPAKGRGKGKARKRRAGSPQDGEEDSGSEEGGGGGGGGGRRAQRRSSGSGGGSKQHVWKQRWCLAGLTFDCEALQQALEAAALAGSSTRVYLSPATLVVVPATLIPHWMQQVGLTEALRLCLCWHACMCSLQQPVTSRPHATCWQKHAWQQSQLVISTTSCPITPLTASARNVLSPPSHMRT